MTINTKLCIKCGYMFGNCKCGHTEFACVAEAKAFYDNLGYWIVDDSEEDVTVMQNGDKFMRITHRGLLDVIAEDIS